MNSRIIPAVLARRLRKALPGHSWRTWRKCVYTTESPRVHITVTDDGLVVTADDETLRIQILNVLERGADEATRTKTLDISAGS